MDHDPVLVDEAVLHLTLHLICLRILSVDGGLQTPLGSGCVNVV